MVDCNNLSDSCYIDSLMDCSTNTFFERKLTTNFCPEKYCGRAHLRYGIDGLYDEEKSHYCLRFDYQGYEEIRIASEYFADENIVSPMTITQSSDSMVNVGIDLKASKNNNENNPKFKLLTVTVVLTQKSELTMSVENIKLMEGACSPERK